LGGEEEKGREGRGECVLRWWVGGALVGSEGISKRPGQAFYGSYMSSSFGQESFTAFGEDTFMSKCASH